MRVGILVGVVGGIGTRTPAMMPYIDRTTYYLTCRTLPDHWNHDTLSRNQSIRFLCCSYVLAWYTRIRIYHTNFIIMHLFLVRVLLIFPHYPEYSAFTNLQIWTTFLSIHKCSVRIHIHNSTHVVANFDSHNLIRTRLDQLTIKHNRAIAIILAKYFSFNDSSAQVVPNACKFNWLELPFFPFARIRNQSGPVHCVLLIYRYVFVRLM